MFIGPKIPASWFFGPKIPFPLSRQRERNRKRKRSMFEPIPAKELLRIPMLQSDTDRVNRRLQRTRRFFSTAARDAYDRAPGQAARDALIDPNGTYLAMMEPQARMDVFRTFGLWNDNDNRLFFEDTGRLSFVIYRARMFFQRRFVKIYQQLRLWGLPRELAAKTMTYYRDALPWGRCTSRSFLNRRTFLNRFRHLHS